MEERPRLRPAERRFAWSLGIIGLIVALIAQLTRPTSDDVDGFIGALGLIFSLGYLVLLAVSVVAARYLMSSGVLRQAMIVAGPIVAMFGLLGVVRLFT